FGQAEVDVRTLPDTDQLALLEHLTGVAGSDVRVEAVLTLPPITWPADAEIVQLMVAALGRADPDGEPAPMMITPGTDAKALALLPLGQHFAQWRCRHLAHAPNGLPGGRSTSVLGYTRGHSTLTNPGMTDETDGGLPASAAVIRRHAFVFPGQGSQYVGMGA